MSSALRTEGSVICTLGDLGASSVYEFRLLFFPSMIGASCGRT